MAFPLGEPPLPTLSLRVQVKLTLSPHPHGPEESIDKLNKCEATWAVLLEQVGMINSHSTTVGECQPGASGRYPVEDGFLGRRPIQKKSRAKRRERDRDLLTLNPWVQPCLKPYTPGPSIHMIIAAPMLLTPDQIGLLSLAITTKLD